MRDDIVTPLRDLLTLTLGAPVVELTNIATDLQQRALLAIGDRIEEPEGFSVGDSRYLACRYHQYRAAVLVVGPFRDASDPPSESPRLGAVDGERAAVALRLAAQGLGRAIDLDQQRIGLASQLEVTSRSVLAITSELALDTVLNRIVDLAREISGARYAALGVPNSSGELESFLTSGMSAEEETRIAHRPHGLGILGLLLREPGTLRLRDLHEHPASVGFPEHHPPMTSFLGVPIMSRGRMLGNLYLTEKRTGDEFTDDDARLVEGLARHAAVAIENARLYRELEVQRQRLQLILDQLPDAALLAESNPDRITLANQQASNLLGWTIQTPMPLEAFLRRNRRLQADAAALPADAAPIVRSLRRGETVRRLEMRLERPDGAHITVLVNSVPLMSQDDRVTGSITVFQDISQIKDAEQLKDDFLSLVSHELRTPLTTIQGGAIVLQRDWEALDRETQHALLADIASESRRLGSLIDNTVQLANIRAGRMRMETEPVHIRRMVESAVAAMHQFAPERTVTFDFEPALIAEADPDRIDQVVRNLLHNALKYSPAGMPIDVSGRRQDGMVRIGIRDYGPGIDAIDVPRLFDRFSRTGNAIASGAPGMGLGLYLSRHMIEAHGGTIWIERPVDGGTQVLFTIPAIREDE